MNGVRSYPRILVIAALLIPALACGGPPTYDRDEPAASMEAMSAELSPEDQQAFVQAVGELVGSFAFQGMSGADMEEDPVLQERLDRMDGMTAQEIIAYAEEVRAEEGGP